ncbi:MAG: hypothetical protein DRJ41_01895 [Thermoprotei archaeon]|nr:MAG: hypothetical protein DRJ41_01895 [Thermoprotei archaeon]
MDMVEIASKVYKPHYIGQRREITYRVCLPTIFWRKHAKGDKLEVVFVYDEDVVVIVPKEHMDRAINIVKSMGAGNGGDIRDREI